MVLLFVVRCDTLDLADWLACSYPGAEVSRVTMRVVPGRLCMECEPVRGGRALDSGRYEAQYWASMSDFQSACLASRKTQPGLRISCTEDGFARAVRHGKPHPMANAPKVRVRI